MTGNELVPFEPRMPTAQMTLAELAEGANSMDALAEKHFKAGAACAIQAGLFLIEAKFRAKHGEWEPWVRENCNFALRTAQLYMKLARHPNAQDVAHLTLTGAVRELEGPATAAAPEPSATDGAPKMEMVEP